MLGARDRQRAARHDDQVEFLQVGHAELVEAEREADHAGGLDVRAQARIRRRPAVTSVEPRSSRRKYSAYSSKRRIQRRSLPGVALADLGEVVVARHRAQRGVVVDDRVAVQHPAHDHGRGEPAEQRDGPSPVPAQRRGARECEREREHAGDRERLELRSRRCCGRCSSRARSAPRCPRTRAIQRRRTERDEGAEHRERDHEHVERVGRRDVYEREAVSRR